MNNNEKGFTRLGIIAIVCTFFLILIIAVAVIISVNKENPNINTNETLEEKIGGTNFVNIVENEIKNTTKTEQKEVDELVFTQEFLESGKVTGNVEIQFSKNDNNIVLSITGASNNAIIEADDIKGKNRWYKNIDLTKYDSLEFYARNGKDNGDVMIFIDDTIVQRIRYTELTTTWSKYKIDISKYKGEHTVSFAGGYADNTGSKDSNTQYCNIKLK